MNDEAIETLIERVEQITSPESGIALYGFGDSAVSEVAPDATAYSHRDAPYARNVARWREPTQDEAHMGWARDTFDAMAPHSTGGVYVNFLSQGKSRIQAAYGEGYDRLVELKDEYDPSNLFRMGQNIEPSS